MKPVVFDVVRARSVTEAARLLVEVEGSARIVAGGQSLGPMLNLRLVQPSILVDVTGIPSMTRVEEDDEAVVLGACITAADVEDIRVPIRGLSMLPSVAMRTAYRAVRNRGTIGGSLCHADPAADWISALCALGAECLIVGLVGSRRVPVDQFVKGAFETALAPDEVLDAIRIPRVSPAGRWGYCKLCHKNGEFAMAIGAVMCDPTNERFRMVIGATQGRPIVVEDARELLYDRSRSQAAWILDQTAVLQLLDKKGILDPIARRHHVVMLQRALDQAIHP
jgi:aerobic carbon-monoxide dehydrogenase medium subunit